ncbi:MAG TPA: HAD family hydrolase [Phycisphaerales bacterium]|nr:HAD family hydrolase [Phycisphaerales bacterium]HRQ75724.1 HAD family hydrolase [Phycisphaerales bacterium]
MLILFDIDGTMLVTERAGIHAMRDAGRELFHPDFTVDGVEFSGRLDPVIYRDLAALNAIDDAEARHDEFRAAYGRHLGRLLGAGPVARALPGVAALIDRLRLHENITLGLLTGNYPETGTLKITRAGFDPSAFVVHAWGVDGATRRHLPRVAVERYTQLRGVGLPPESVIVIGDTPHDVDCARAHACRSLAVATGLFSVDELLACGADHAVQDLSETEAVLGWLLQDQACVWE